MTPCANGFQHAVDIPKHVVVPKAQNLEASVRATSITNCIRLAFIVLPAVDLNDESRFEANEVNKVRTDLNLATKAQAVELFGTEMPPEEAFCIRRVLSQVSSERAVLS